MLWKMLLYPMLSLCFTNVLLADESDLIKVSVQIDTALPSQPDTYLNVGKDLPEDETYFIVMFEPLASMEKVHHMIANGCNGHPKGNVPGDISCDGGSTKIIYAWARGAPSLKLPKGVGFKAGKDSDVKSIILQIHYGNVSAFAGEKDHSGINVYLTREKLKKEAGVLLMATGGVMAPNITENYEVACKIDDDIKLHPFAFRTHTHRHGLLVSGYNIHQKPDGSFDVQLIGAKNPLLPQFFYPVVNDAIVIQKGNIIAARCTMKNNEDREVYVGSTSNDEMCNFYTMYYVEDGKFPTSGCGSPGPPHYHWSTDKLLKDIAVPK